MDTISDSTGIRGSVESLIGGRKENQDSYGMADTRLGLFVVVCDGMGGGPAGKTASSIATQTLIDYVSGADRDKSPYSVLADAVKAANEAVLAAVSENPALRGMGTTCVCLLIGSREAYIVHVGDSRCYQLRGSRAIFRTADHSYVGEMVRRGTLTEEEARNSNYSNIITRAIGGAQDVDPEVDSVEYKPGDRFALMTDGIWGAIPEMQLVKFLVEKKDPAVLVPEIAYNIDSLGADNGGMHDNLTLALVEIPAGKAPLSTESPVHGNAGRIEPQRTPQRPPEGPRPLAQAPRRPEERRAHTVNPERNRKPATANDVRGEKRVEEKEYKNREEKEKKRRKPLSPAVWICLIVLACAISVGLSMIFYHPSEEPVAGNPGNEVVTQTDNKQTRDKKKTSTSSSPKKSGKQSKSNTKGANLKDVAKDDEGPNVPIENNVEKESAAKSQNLSPENEYIQKAIKSLQFLADWEPEIKDVNKLRKKHKDYLKQHVIDILNHNVVNNTKVNKNKQEKVKKIVKEIERYQDKIGDVSSKDYKATEEAVNYINKYKEQLQELMQQ